MLPCFVLVEVLACVVLPIDQLALGRRFHRLGIVVEVGLDLGHFDAHHFVGVLDDSQARLAIPAVLKVLLHLISIFNVLILVAEYSVLRLRIHFKAGLHILPGLFSALKPAVVVQVAVIISLALSTRTTESLALPCKRPFVGDDATQVHIALIMLVARVALFVSGARELLVFAAGAHALSVITAGAAIVQVLAHVFSHLATLFGVLLVHLRL